ncbi:uncharacterized protein Dwil_GK12934 [Drosophila willistoni]|uniref:MADF domain-containing protein n=1 Tax=Drosophila willistoni TaxID=7260 RepID=B4N3K7_DROWI|nr:uncharacterized protein Dwil_GK12934 [Drosophila willistoni]
MAFSRHNIEKRRLIELVRQNPILWDCRLPHYKRSDKKKAIKWNELGRMFNVNGERVQRTFTSLREIFRRELNHEKMLGAQRFTSKWEYYDAMAFLKEVIRERKSRERIKHDSTSGETSNNNNNNVSSNNNNNSNSNNNNNNNNSVTHDEYQYFAPSDPNNPNNQLKTGSTVLPQSQALVVPLATMPLPLPLPLSLPLPQSQLPLARQQQAQHLQALQLQPDVTLTSLKPTSTTTPMTTNTATTTPTAASATSPTQVLLSSSRSCSSSPSIYIKDEPDDSQDDDEDDDEILKKPRQKLATIRPATKQQLKSRLQLPKTNREGPSGGTDGAIARATALYATPPPHLIINANNELIDADAGDLDDDLEDDFDEEEEDDESRVVDVDMMTGLGGRLSPSSSFGIGGSGVPVGGHGVGRGGIGNTHHTHHHHHQQGPRELLYNKFGDFLAARLNTLSEPLANELMNKILLLIAEK